MATIEPVMQDLRNPEKVKKYSPNVRLWHWLNFIVIGGLLLTVLINETVLDRQPVSLLISEQFGKSGIPENQAAVGGIAHELSERVWTLHGYIGILLVLLFAYRVITEFTVPRSQLLSYKIKEARSILKKMGPEHYLARHELTVKLIYIAFYIVMVMLVVTGLTLFLRNTIGLDRSLAHEIKEIHGFCMYVIIGFIIVHLAGVILAELKRSPGIVSDMIHGGRDLKN